MNKRKLPSLTVGQVIFLNNRKEILDYPCLLFLNIHHLKLIILNSIISNRVHRYQSHDLIPTEYPNEQYEMLIKHTLNVE